MTSANENTSGTSTTTSPADDFVSRFLTLELDLCRQLRRLPRDPGVTHVYSPVEHARECHEAFLNRFQAGPRPVLLLGMNPGPWGMVQTGVPFGEITAVRDWMQLSGEVTAPSEPHPKRPVVGLGCPRREVSGERFWGLLRDLTPKDDPETFFRHCAVYNHCPLSYMAASGKNVTPVDMKPGVRNLILEVCDEALKKVLLLLEVRAVVAIGRYAEVRAKKVIASMERDDALEGSVITVHYMNHPSPASAQANKNWKGIALQQLSSAGVVDLLKS